VGPVDIGICHDDDAMVPQFFEIELVRPDTAADRSDQRLDLSVAQEFVEPRLFNVQQLTADRQDRLIPAVAALLGGTAGGVTLNDLDFALGWVPFRTVRQLAGQREPVESAFPLGQLTGTLGGFAAARSQQRLVDD
jgi:hypothetical protein